MSKCHKILQRGLAFLFQVHEKFKACGNSKKSCSSDYFIANHSKKILYAHIQ